MQVEVINQEGQIVRQLDLDPKIWKTAYSPLVTSLVNRNILVNQRQNTSKVKARGEVKGSGRKIWQQKGTGRARHGSKYAPQFRGGGVAFGPNGDKKAILRVNKKQGKLALCSLLSEKLRRKELFIIEEVKLTVPKTKEANNLLKNLPLNPGNILVILEKNEPMITRAFANLPQVKINNSLLVNVAQILISPNVIFTVQALTTMEKRLN